MRTLSFQVLFTGGRRRKRTRRSDVGSTPHSFSRDAPFDEWPEPIPTYLAQP